MDNFPTHLDVDDIHTHSWSLAKNYVIAFQQHWQVFIDHNLYRHNLIGKTHDRIVTILEDDNPTSFEQRLDAITTHIGQQALWGVVAVETFLRNNPHVSQKLHDELHPSLDQRLVHEITEHALRTSFLNRTAEEQKIIAVLAPHLSDIATLMMGMCMDEAQGYVVERLGTRPKMK